MGKGISRGRSRRRRISAAARFLRREGRKLCAAALCTSLIFGNIANTAVAADKDTDKEIEFKLSRGSLYKALQEAVLEGNTSEEEFSFEGEEAEAYEALLEADGDLYELTSAVKNREKDLKLRVFARLEQDIELESAYEVGGSEEIIFLLSNTSEEARNAVIYVDEKYTDPIEIAPGKAVEVSGEEKAPEAADAAADGAGSTMGAAGGAGNTAGGSGSGSGGGSGSGSGSSSAEITIEKETDSGQQDTSVEKDSEVSIVEEEKNENAKEEKNGGAEEDQKQQDADIYIDVDKDKDKDIDKDTADVGSTDGADLGNKAESDNNADIDNEANSQNGTDSEYSNPSEDHTSDSSAEAGASSGSEVSADSSSDSGSEDSGSEDGGQSTENSSDAGSTDTGHPMASISVHPVYRVTDTGIATPSKATDADADENLLDGTLYNAVRLENDGAVALVVDAAELGLDDPALEKLASPSDADYAFIASLGDVIVHVFADQGVLPENAELRVTELREDDSETAEKFQEAKDALDAENTEYSGMMALDISSYDEDGNEIEPDGDVQVSIEMNTAMLPGDVNPESVAVQHLAETTDGIQVQTVADSTDEVDGTVEVTEEGEVVTAEFGVKSFSTFTITWGTGRQTSSEEELDTVEGIDTSGIIDIRMFDYDDSISTANFPFNGSDWTGRNGGVRQGVVQNKLANGFPVRTNDGRSLGYLFTSGTEANKLFQKDAEGYYYYDSGQNFAQLEQNGEFTLYTVPRCADETVPPSFPQFLPFNTLMPEMSIDVNNYSGDSGYGKLYRYHRLEESVNYHFGMSIGFDFIQPKDGKITNDNTSRDMVFEFEGDDDVWVFIDGVLVLDMGGVHDNYGGSINFATDEIEVEKVNGQGGPVYTTISDMFEEAGETWNGSDYSGHTLQFFYLERGGGGSNCKIRFNLPAIPRGTINFQKALAYSNVADAADFDFEFKTYVNYEGKTDGTYSLYTGAYDIYDSSDLNTAISSGIAADGIIKLKDGQVARLTDDAIQVTSKFYVEEVGATSDKYNVTVNGTKVEYIYDDADSTTVTGVKTSELMVGESPYITFENSVAAENQFNLQIKKVMSDGSIPAESFKVKLLLGGSQEPYTGTYDLYSVGGIKIKTGLSADSDGVITLQAGEYAQVTGLVGGNKIRVEEVNLTDEYGTPLYAMNGPLVSEPQIDASGIAGTALEGKNLGSDPTVIAQITNNPKPSVTIRKSVEGNMGDRSKSFTFTIEVKDASGNPINVDGNYSSEENTVAIANGQFSLKHGESVTIPKLSNGVSVKVIEDDYSSSDGYITTVKVGDAAGKNGRTGEINHLAVSTEILFTNSKGINIPTGIFASRRPYLLMLALAAIGITGFTFSGYTRKKRRDQK